MLNPLVSVVMPTFNRREFIGYAVDSVLNQTWRKLELIVVDDGSTDDTGQFLGMYAADIRFKYIYQNNQGQSIARNRGIKESGGEFIAFLDSDNIWYLDKLEKQISIVERNSSYDIFYGDGVHIDVNGNVLSRNNIKRYSGTITKYLLRDNCVSMNSTIVRKACIDDLGGFVDDDKVAEDYELWLRLSTKYKFLYTSDYYMEYRVMENQLSTDKDSRFIGNELILHNFINKYPDTISKSDMDRGMSYFYVRKARYEITTGRYKRVINDLLKAFTYDMLWRGPWVAVAKMLTSFFNK